MKSTKLKIKSISILAIWLFTTTCFISFSQKDDLNANLVLNGSFEDLVKKEPKKLGEISKTRDWSSLTDVKADLFRSGLKDNNYISTNKNTFGKEDPQDGESYAGVIAYQKGKKSKERSYVTVSLSTPLKKNKEYYVEFYVSLAEASKYAINNMGIVIAKGALNHISDKVIPKIISDKNTLILQPEGKTINAFNGWQKICGTFTAKGKEETIVIGNFLPDAQTKTESVKKPKTARVTVQALSYYYVDNVVLREYFADEDALRVAKSISTEDWEEMDSDEKEFEPCECSTEKAKEDQYSTLIYQREVIIDDDMTLKQEIEAYEIYFGFGKNEIPEESKFNLREVVKLLKANANLSVTIVGHSDKDEDKVANDKPKFAKMDSKRALSVYKELIEFGIAASRITKTSKGNTIPSDLVYLDPEGLDDPEELELNSAKNRRVEFLVK